MAYEFSNTPEVMKIQRFKTTKSIRNSIMHLKRSFLQNYLTDKNSNLSVLKSFENITIFAKLLVKVAYKGQI